MPTTTSADLTEGVVRHHRLAAPMPLGDRLLELRRSRGLTQVQLGKIFAVGAPSLSSWETGKPVPDDRIRQYATYFAVQRSGAVQDRLLSVDELTSDERRTQQALEAELMALVDASVAATPTQFRPASEGAQKFLVDFMIVTVILSGRAIQRRITERLITSQDPGGLPFFVSRAFSSGFARRGRSYVPTTALWGCRATDSDDDGLPATRLWFPKTLPMGAKAHFAAEAVYTEHEQDLHGWCNVEVDHHGIEPGSCFSNGVPVTGLTVRVQFDPDDLPSAVWWYAEQNEDERYVEPMPGSPRGIPITGGAVTKTFENACQPRENYGIAYTWAPPQE